MINKIHEYEKIYKIRKAKDGNILKNMKFYKSSNQPDFM